MMRVIAWAGLTLACLASTACDRVAEGKAHFTSDKPTPGQVFIQSIDHDGQLALSDSYQLQNMQEIGMRICTVLNDVNEDVIEAGLMEETLGDGEHPTPEQALSILHASEKAYCPWRAGP